MPSAVIKEIRGRKFSFAKLDAIPGIKLQLGIAKLAGSEISMLISLFANAAKTLPKDAPAGPDAIKTAILSSGALEEAGEILQRVADKADPDEVVRLMTLVFSRVVCDGRPIQDINATFGDDSFTPWLVFVEGVKVNLGDFLAESPSAGSQPATPTPSG